MEPPVGRGGSQPPAVVPYKGEDRSSLGGLSIGSRARRTPRGLEHLFDCNKYYKTFGLARIRKWIVVHLSVLITVTKNFYAGANEAPGDFLYLHELS